MTATVIKFCASAVLFGAAGIVIINAVVNQDVTSVAMAFTTLFGAGVIHEALWD